MEAPRSLSSSILHDTEQLVVDRSRHTNGVLETGREGLCLRRESLELLQATGVHGRVRFVQECELQGQVPPLFLVVHVRKGCVDAVHLLPELDDLHVQVHGVLPGLLEPVEQQAEEVLHEGDGGEDHACEAQMRANLGGKKMQKCEKMIEKKNTGKGILRKKAFLYSVTESKQ